MPDIVTIITPTGWRPQTLALCAKYIYSQSYQGEIQWIVVNDSKQPLNLAAYGPNPRNINTLEVEGPVTWQEGLNTQKTNLKEALKYVKGKYLFFIEDDDFYSSKFIEYMVWMLDRFAVVGEANSKYYNVQVPGWKQMRNYMHSSLCATGMRIEVLPQLEKAIAAQGLYIDIELWKNVREAGLPSILICDKQLSVGIKGMPGRAGIGVGHSKTKDFFIDPKGDKLAEWIGAEVVSYRPFLSTKFNKVVNEEAKKAPRVQSGSQENTGRGLWSGTGVSNPSVKNTQSVAQSQAQKPFAAKS